MLNEFYEIINVFNIPCKDLSISGKVIYYRYVRLKHGEIIHSIKECTIVKYFFCIKFKTIYIRGELRAARQAFPCGPSRFLTF